MTDVFNRYDRDSMIELADAYDVNIPATENPLYMARAREYIDERQPLLVAEVTGIMAGATPQAEASSDQADGDAGLNPEAAS